MRESLVYAIGVAVSPAPIALVTVILTSLGVLVNGVFFVAGWGLGVAFAITLLVVLVDQANAVAASTPSPGWTPSTTSQERGQPGSRSFWLRPIRRSPRLRSDQRSW